MTAFEEFGVIPELAKAVEAMEWLLPTDVQAEAVPLILGGDFPINFTTISSSLL
jgi:ATP-dependent RNA helicase DDX1